MLAEPFLDLGFVQIPKGIDDSERKQHGEHRWYDSRVHRENQPQHETIGQEADYLCHFRSKNKREHGHLREASAEDPLTDVCDIIRHNTVICQLQQTARGYK